MTIATLGPPALEPLDEFGEVGGPLGFADERVFEKLFGRRTVGRVTLEAEVDKLFKRSRKGTFELRRGVLGNEEEDLHRMKVSVGRLAHGKLDGGDAQTPNVGLEIVPALFDHLGAHPVRRADKSVFLGHGGCELTRDTEIGEFDVTCGGQKDVGSLDVAVQLAFTVQVLETLEQLAHYDGNVVFAESAGFHLCGMGRRGERR